MENFKTHLQHYILADGLSKALPMLVLPWIANNMTGADFGTYSLFILYITIGNTILLLGIEQSIFRFIPSTLKTQGQRLMGAALLILGLSSISMLLVTGIFHNSVISFLFNDSTAINWYDLPLIMAITALNNLILTYLKAEKKSKVYGIIFLIKTATFYGILVGGIILWNDVSAITMAFYGSNIITAALLIPQILSKISTPQNAEYRKLIYFGLPMLGILFSGILLNQVDHYLIKYYMGINYVGEYHFSYKYAMALGLVVITINQVWLPRLFERGSEYFKTTFPMLSRASMLLLTLIIFVMVIAFGILKENSLLPGNFAIMDIFPILSIAFIFYAGIHQLDSVLLLNEKVRFLGMIYFIALMINIIGNIYAIPEYFLLGAAYLTLISFIFIWLCLIIYIFLQKEYSKTIVNYIYSFIAIISMPVVAFVFDMIYPIFFLNILLLIGIVISMRKKSII